MNIFLISNMYPSSESPFYGIFVKTFVENIQNQEVNISSKAIIKGRSNNIFLKVYKYIKFFLKVYSCLLRPNYDIIYVHYAEHSLLPLLPIYFLLKKKLVINAHGDDIKLDSYISSLVTPIIRKADLLVVPSNYFKEFAVSKNLNKNIIVSASGGINIEKFKPVDKKNNSKDFVIGYVSRIDKDKGWETLIYAAEKLMINIPNLKVVLVGRGAQENDLKELIKSSSAKEKVNFVGSVANEKLPTYYSGFDVFVFPSIRESLGVVGLEAIACGTPVIGSKIGPIEEYIVNGHNGFLFTPGDANDLVKKIELYYSLDKEKQTQFRQNAHEISQKYDSIEVAKKLKNHLQELM